MIEDHIDHQETAPPKLRCPFCGSGSLAAVPSRPYLVCQECCRKIHYVSLSAVRMGMLLDAFTELLIHSYDDEMNLRSESVREAVREELSAQGFQSAEEYLEACRGQEEVVTIPEIFARHCGLSRTALQALSRMLAEHDFGEGPLFFENVFRALGASRRVTASQGRLYKQLEGLAVEERKLLSEKLQEAWGRRQRATAK